MDSGCQATLLEETSSVRLLAVTCLIRVARMGCNEIRATLARFDQQVVGYLMMNTSYFT